MQPRGCSHAVQRLRLHGTGLGGHPSRVLTNCVYLSRSRLVNYFLTIRPTIYEKIEKHVSSMAIISFGSQFPIFKSWWCRRHAKKKWTIRTYWCAEHPVDNYELPSYAQSCCISVFAVCCHHTSWISVYVVCLSTELCKVITALKIQWTVFYSCLCLLAISKCYSAACRWCKLVIGLYAPFWVTLGLNDPVVHQFSGLSTEIHGGSYETAR